MVSVLLSDLLPDAEERFHIRIWDQWLEKNIIVSCLYFSLYNKSVITEIIYLSWLPLVMCP